MAAPNEKADFQHQEQDTDEHVHDEQAHDLELSKTGTTMVEGTTKLYVDGNLQYVPMPTADPRDPLNLPTWHKAMAIASLCLYGSIALTAQQIVGSLLPIFVLEYAGLPASLINSLSNTGAPSTGNAPQAINPNPLAGLAAIPSPNPLWRVNLISSLPILVTGISNYFLIPLSVIFGRRPVVLFCGLLAWVGCIWAGKSRSLNEHLGARAVQAIGAGAVESLVPYIVQDMTFIHQRNRAIGVIWASQGIVTLALGIGSSHLVSNKGWRWLYFVMGILGAGFWVMMCFFVPETRYKRTAQQLRGESEDPLPPGHSRPAIDHNNYARRTVGSSLALYQGPAHFKAGLIAVKELTVSLFFPNVFMIILLNGAFIGMSLASAQTLSPVLLAPPYNWPFANIGLTVIGIFISSIFIWFIGSVGSDRLANWITKRKGGRREPEVQLYNLAFPVFCGILGCVLFGVGGSYSHKVHWVTILLGNGMLNFGFLTTNIVGSVYCIESYPAWAGPVLVNAASFRNFIGFALSFFVTDWVTARGYMGCFGIFAGVLVVLSFGLVFVALYGKAMRKKVGRVVKTAPDAL